MTQNKTSKSAYGGRRPAKQTLPAPSRDLSARVCAAHREAVREPPRPYMPENKHKLRPPTRPKYWLSMHCRAQHTTAALSQTSTIKWQKQKSSDNRDTSDTSSAA